MKKLLILSGFILLIPIMMLDARGREPGGGGGHGGGGGGGRSVNRSPSMSRSVPKPSQQVKRGENRGQGNQAQAQQQAYQRIRNEQRERARPKAQNNNQASQFKNQINNRNSNNNNWKNSNRNFKNRYPNYNQWFGSDFYRRHGNYPNYYRNGYNGWRSARWSNLNGYLGYGWGYPYYYDDTGSYYPYTDYSPSIDNSQSYYINQTSYGASDDDSWLPLGVFVLSPSSTQIDNSSAVIQLAVNKQGEMDGTFYFPSIDKAYDVAGVVDQQNQLVTIQLSDDPNSPLMTTGLYNLTQAETPIRMDFPGGITQTWVLTRLQDDGQP